MLGIDAPERCSLQRLVKRGDTMAADLEIKERLISEYKKLKRARNLAEKEGAKETVKYLDEEIAFIKVTLQPLELPEI